MGRTVKYAEIEPRLKTGDILLCHSVMHESIMIEFIEGSMWSHIGMIVRLPQYDYPLLWESTTFDNVKDVLLGKTKTGPMLVPLYERIRTDIDNLWDPMFAFRLLETERPPEMEAALLALIQEVHGGQFPGEVEMLEIVTEGKLGIRSGSPNRFCSQLFAETYIRLGLLPPKRVPNSYWPIDFSSEGRVSLLNQATLSEEFYLLADGIQTAEEHEVS
ncbi:hypothetical protein JNUCC31_29420 [Paenibacillus sp. JNUCC31]|uniref:hypothetical protein n=1 Tax=Paenibacillus sp. JNUCC-31 TaxID=2777983 RepID=UPI00178031DD|nr:hypothetical protein [Paenibacillus sp. JNUCC-31]QOS78765.1 hypothetical protein JNUCC31_29420 [Paenibacillus sp. JNUCC-31]